MQRHSISMGDEAAVIPPSYPPQIYDSSLPSPMQPVRSDYQYGPTEPNPAWRPYPNQEPYSAPQWYPPSTSAAGPSVPTTYTPPETSPGFAPRQGSYSRPSYSLTEYTHPPPPPPSQPAPSPVEAPETQEGKDKAVPKKKRRRMTQREGSANSADGDKDKRTKTGRACDACRAKKIRCDIISPARDDSPAHCAHCKHQRLECTFFLPMTETRFKRKKPIVEDTSRKNSASAPFISTESPDGDRPKEVPGRIEGPTSLAFLLHTSLPASASEAYDLRYHHTWEISEGGNGIIRVKAPPSSHASRYAESGDPDNRLNRSIINAHTISLLVNAYFDHLSHLFPVISRSEFAAKATPPPFLLFSICGLGATRREFPREVFAGIRGVINGMLRSNDILSDARIENVQALLILAQVGDLHAQPTAATASASLMRTGSAIRMAQDLGLHRESHLRATTPQELAYVELRRRIWATCVIMDRWYGAALGIPLQVDLLDCDVLLPAGYEIILDQPPNTWPIEPSHVALTEHLKLSILIGRILKTMYSPTGLKHATDEQLYSILEDMRAWKEELPEGLRFIGPESSFASGMLHLAYTTLHFLLWRPFMRITYICPPHLGFALETLHWSEMAKWATEALDWLNHNPQALDTVFIYAYTATSCALVQYHTWVRRQEPGSLESLKQVRETAVNWEIAVQPDQMSIRRKTCETMTLLYEAALKTNPEEDRPPAINPTAGVLPRPAIGKARWLADPSKPYGGIWVAEDNAEKADSGLSENSVVLKNNMSQERLPPEMESTDPTIRARVMSRLRGPEVNSSQAVNGNGGEGSENDSAGGSYVDGHREEKPQLMPVNQQANGIDLLTQGIQMGQHIPQQDPMGIFREMQMAGSNVNPQLNFGVPDFTNGQNGVQNGFGADPNIQIYDPALLDGLPANGFDFDQWNAWFSNIDRMAPANSMGQAPPYQHQQMHQHPGQHNGQWN